MRYKLLIAMAALGLVATPALATDPIQGLVNTCNNCHGTGGVSVGHSMPSIAGLSATYLKNILMEWKSGARASANMSRLISGYTDAEIAALATYYSKLPWTPQVQPVAADLIAKGKDITDRCETCHGVTGGKPDDEETPRLNGQWAKYLELEMLKYRDPGFQMTHKKMIKNTQKLEQGDVATAAQYYGAQSK